MTKSRPPEHIIHISAFKMVLLISAVSVHYKLCDKPPKTVALMYLYLKRISRCSDQVPHGQAIGHIFFFFLRVARYTVYASVTSLNFFSACLSALIRIRMIFLRQLSVSLFYRFSLLIDRALAVILFLLTFFLPSHNYKFKITDFILFPFY